MRWLFVLGGGLLVLGGVLFFTDTFRTAKSLYLISRTEPYEQEGSGPTSVLVIGDSTGYGTGVTDVTKSIAGRIGADFPDVTIHNNSVNGRQLEQLVSDMPTLDRSYTVILLQMGANDILQERPVADTLADLETIYNMLLPHTEHIVLMTSGNVGGAKAFTGKPEAVTLEARSREYYAAFAQFAASHPQFTFVDLFEERSEDKFVLDPDTYMALDGLHPSEAGYGLWYEKLKQVLMQFLN